MCFEFTNFTNNVSDGTATLTLIPRPGGPRIEITGLKSVVCEPGKSVVAQLIDQAKDLFAVILAGEDTLPDRD